MPRVLINLLVRLLESGGFHVPRRVPAVAGHERIFPIATWAPWTVDTEFQELYSKLRDNTLIDIYRCYELWTLAKQLAGLQGDFLEVGVWRGGSAAILGSALAQNERGGTLYLADTFQGVVKATAADSTYSGGEHADTSKALVSSFLWQKFGLSNFKILTGIFPDDTAHLVEDQRFSLVHIDVDVYESAKGVDEWTWPRLVVGGMVIYDDYGFCDGVTRYVDEQIGKPDRRVVYNLNGHALVTKLA